MKKRPIHVLRPHVAGRVVATTFCYVDPYRRGIKVFGIHTKDLPTCRACLNAREAEIDAEHAALIARGPVRRIQITETK